MKRHLEKQIDERSDNQLNERSETLPTAYCETMACDKSVVEKCRGNQACIREEVKKCLKAERYYCEPNFDKGKSVNAFLEEKHFTIQSIIATQHFDTITSDTISKADYIRATSPQGIPFVIYLDSRGYVEAEGCTIEMTCLQNECLVSDSALKAAYKMCVPAVRGVALFSNTGISVAMYGAKMQMITYHHLYVSGVEDSTNKDILEVAVPYPILPLSEILCKPQVVCERLNFVMEPLRKLFIERSIKVSKDVEKQICEFSGLTTNFNIAFFERLQRLTQSIEKLRQILKDNEKCVCPCEHKCQNKNKVYKCECDKRTMIQVTRYNIEVRERYVNEMIALFSAYSAKLKLLSNLHHDMYFMQEILDDRYSDFDNLKIDPSAPWAEQLE